MALNRASPLDEPPTASSSEGEEEVSSREKPEEEQEGDSSSEEEEEGDSSSEEDDEEEEPAKASSSLPPPAPEKKSPPKKPLTSATPQPHSSSSDSDSDSDSDSGAEEDQPNDTADSKVKPTASKPMEEASKNSKAQPSAAPSGSGTKRPNENSGPESGAKRAKGTDTAFNNDVLVVADAGKKSDSRKLFQRLWSEDDEIALLGGMDEYRVQKGADPYKNMDSFHCFVKESLHVSVSRSQLMDKIWRLKKKYERRAIKLKDGEGPRFAKLHDKEVFELSKKIWGSEGTNRIIAEKSNGIGRIIKKCGSRMNVASPQAQLALILNSDCAEKMHADQNSGSIISVNQIIKYSGLNEDVIRMGYESLETSKRTKLEESWKLIELEFFVKRAELIRDLSMFILEAYRSSNH